MALLLAKLVVAYLLGSLSGSLLLGRLHGIDIRQSGSGNAGGTNALRVVGWRFALAVVVIDVGKGTLAALLGLAPIGGTAATPSAAVTLAAACSFAAVIGHCWPVFFGFRGGKGAGTALGAGLVLAPALAGMMVVLWLLVVASTRYVGMATVLAGLSFPVFVLLAGQFGHAQGNALLVFSIAIALLIVFTHRGNLQRLWRGQEPRLGGGGKQ